MITIPIFGYALRVNDTKPTKKFFLIYVCMVLIIISAIRSVDVGNDTLQYWRAFTRISELPVKDLWTTRYEPGFVILCYLLGLISDNPQILLVVTSFIIFIPFFIFFYRNSEDVVLSSYLFVSLSMFGLYLSMMRQAIAIAIILMGLEFFYKKKKYFIFFLFCLLAWQFHNSALIASVILLYPLIRKWTIKKIGVAIALIPVIFVLANWFFEIFAGVFGYLGYADSQFFESNYFAAVIKGLMNAAYLWLLVACGGVSKEPLKRGIDGKISVVDENNLFFDTFLITIFFVQLFFLVCGIRIVIMERVGYYYSVFALIIIPRAIKNSFAKRDRFIISYFIIVVTFLYWIIVAFLRPKWLGVVPYSIFTQM